MTGQYVRYEMDNRGVARITLDQPDKRNAFDGHIIRELTEALEKAAGESACRAVILAGAGKHFSAGADLDHMKQTATLSHEDNIADAEALAKLMYTLDRLPVPTIARVQGAAFGGALGLICTCDIAIAADNARFCLSEVRLGLAPAAIGPYVVRVLGERQARRYFLTTEEIRGEKVVALGLAHEMVPEDQLDDVIDGIVEKLLRNGPNALKACKSLIARIGDYQPDADMTRYTAHLIADLRTGHEGQEGLQAFLEKRQPDWIKE